jgi:hypothetical protein
MSKFKNFFQSIGNFIREAFSDIKDLLDSKAPQAVRLTQVIKLAIEEHDGKFEWVLARLKHEGLDELYLFAKTRLPMLVKELAVIDNLVRADDTQEDAWNAYMGYIASKSKQSRTKDIILFAAQVLGAIIGKRDTPLAALIIKTQEWYLKIFGNK